MQRVSLLTNAGTQGPRVYTVYASSEFLSELTSIPPDETTIHSRTSFCGHIPDQVAEWFIFGVVIICRAWTWLPSQECSMMSAALRGRGIRREVDLEVKVLVDVGLFLALLLTFFQMISFLERICTSVNLSDDLERFSHFHL